MGMRSEPDQVSLWSPDEESGFIQHVKKKKKNLRVLNGRLSELIFCLVGFLGGAEWRLAWRVKAGRPVKQ